MAYGRDMPTGPVDLPTLSTELSTLVSRLNRRLRSEAGAQAFTPSQTSVFRHLLTVGSATTSQLARAQSVRPQSMSATVASLQKLGFLERSADPIDGRAMVVAMTDAGRSAIDASRAAKRGWLTRALDEQLTDGEQHQLVVAVALLERLLDPL